MHLRIKLEIVLYLGRIRMNGNNLFESSSMLLKLLDCNQTVLDYNKALILKSNQQISLFSRLKVIQELNKLKEAIKGQRKICIVGESI
ncbi:unnamed protein product [Paramecium octaurelia]|uniref:Uncharacterized protein n=1 Tax=Paramecium octaurelia TaxID=43137 RepID=A0A8S1TCY9_PAROT|nr:unnamed protein product [Paramecium octaurelia]